MRTTVIGMISVILVGMAITPMLVQTEPPRQPHGASASPATASAACGQDSATKHTALKLACRQETVAQIAQAQ